MTIQNIKVPDGSFELRLDIFLAQQMADIPSRTFVKKLIDSGQVTVNMKKVKAHHHVLPGDEIQVDLPESPAPTDLKPEPIPLDIFYEDDFLLVVNKPFGMLVHPTSGICTGTLVNALLHHGSNLSDVNGLLRPGIVHRLDRETSGLMVVAKDSKTHVRLARQFEQHLVHKRYVALVNGNIDFEEGMIDVPIGRHPLHWDKRSVAFDEASKEATTFFRVLKRFDGQATLVALFPKSGRTHQLRVHMRHLGHSILGDQKYGDRDNSVRMKLHAQSLGFIHPQNKGFLEFFSSLPKGFLTGTFLG